MWDVDLQIAFVGSFLFKGFTDIAGVEGMFRFPER